jgi:hypothetical protein
MYVSRTVRRVRETTVVVEKQQVLHIPSVCVTLVIKHAKRTRLIVICGQSGSAIYFHVIS